jgi:hypothetical protein
MQLIKQLSPADINTGKLRDATNSQLAKQLLPAVVTQCALSSTDNIDAIPWNKPSLKLIFVAPDKPTVFPLTITDVNGDPLLDMSKNLFQIVMLDDDPPINVSALLILSNVKSKLAIFIVLKCIRYLHQALLSYNLPVLVRKHL